MIAHQTISLDLPFRLLTGLTQREEKPLPVVVVPENILSAITAIHHMVHRPWILNAQFAWHESRLPAGPKVSIVRTDTCHAKVGNSDQPKDWLGASVLGVVTLYPPLGHGRSCNYDVAEERVPEPSVLRQKLRRRKLNALPIGVAHCTGNGRRCDGEKGTSA